MSDFYRAFEDKYRGSREQILKRLAAYRPYLSGIKKQVDSPVGLDLGCGRGEWLEVLRGNGFQASGVDMDAEMLEDCKTLGLNVYKADLFDYLAKIDSHSIDLLSAFHVIEHIGFEQLQNLMQEAKRVLKPGGLLILETPNPENISVASNSFYLDPSHTKPLPPLLMAFLAEHYAFERSAIFRLDNYKEFSPKQRLNLMDVLMYVSPDYALIAQTERPEMKTSLEDPMEELFARELKGHSLERLSVEWDQQYLNDLNKLDAQISRLVQKQHEQEAIIKELQHNFQYLFKKKIKGALQSLNIRWRSFNQKLTMSRIKSAVKTRIKRVLWKLKNKIVKYPKLQRWVMSALNKVPFVSIKLRRLMHSVGSDSIAHSIESPEELNPRAATIFSQIESLKNKKAE